MTRKTQRKRTPSAQVVELALADTILDVLIGGPRRDTLPTAIAIAREIFQRFTVEIRRES